MRCAIVEAETREEVMQEMEARITDMQKGFAKRLRQAVSTNAALLPYLTHEFLKVEHSEAKTDAKIDMLHQFGAFNGKKTKPQTESESEEVDIHFPHSSTLSLTTFDS